MAYPQTSLEWYAAASEHHWIRVKRLQGDRFQNWSFQRRSLEQAHSLHRRKLNIDAPLMGDLKSIPLDKRTFMSPRLGYWRFRVGRIRAALQGSD